MKKIYFNGNFITLEDNKPVQAILVENGIIKKVGTNAEIITHQNDTEMVDLNGNTIMPAFIDSHSHFMAVANEFLQVSLKDCRNFEEIKSTLLGYKSKNNIEAGKWIKANGYDKNNLIENSNITKKELDIIFPDNPVVIQHQS